MRKVSFVATLCIFCAAGFPAQGEEPVVAIGKQRAARSAIAWVVHETDHAHLGPIRFAARKEAVTTATTGSERILSQVYISCQLGLGIVAIELTNAAASDPAGGLRPTDMPRLVCSSPAPGRDGGTVQSDLAARWEIRPLGDVLARELLPADLRRCVAIDVLQSVALPAGSPQKSQQIAMEVLPYDRALDAVFTACGETTAFAPLENTPAAAQWKFARTVAKGRTYVRAAASVDAALVVKLEPGTKVLARRVGSSWWEVKPRSGKGVLGYIRESRLDFD